MIYRGYRIRIGGPHPDGCVQIWDQTGKERITRCRTTTQAEKIIDEWQNAR